MTLTRVKIGQLGKIITGKTPPTAKKEFYNGDFPFITPTDIYAFDIKHLKSTERSLSDLWQKKASKYLLPKNSICYVCIGSTVGKLTMNEKPSFTNQQINSIICNDEIINQDYFYYKLRIETPKIRSVANSRGAGKPIINKTGFENIEIDIIQDIKQQEKIAEVLSNYDSLIENNNRQIEILEETLKVVYKEWFIKDISDQNKKDMLTEYVDFVRGVEPGSNNYMNETGDGLLPFLRVGDLGSRNSELFINEDLAKGKILKEDDIVLTLDGTVGIVKIGMEGCYSTGIRKLKILNNHISKVFLYCLMKSEDIQKTIKSNAKGTTIMHAGSAVNKMEFSLPPQDIMDKFSEITEPLLKEILILNKKNRNLISTRDLLLPKLMSGEIEL
ncbi:MAG TPA: restriction endonuclease subunit S [Bacilli bacterium]|mgnify:CR=1 FL=1|nr:restriction endonuclease subunit S [Bacilli bacterium]